MHQCNNREISRRESEDSYANAIREWSVSKLNFVSSGMAQQWQQRSHGSTPATRQNQKAKSKSNSIAFFILDSIRHVPFYCFSLGSLCRRNFR